MIYPKNVFNFS